MEGIMCWNLNDLTVTTGAPTALAQPTGYVFDAYGTQHVTYLGIDGHIHELLWDPTGWHHHDLTSLTSSPQGQNTAIGYVFLDTQHVIYFGAGVDELWRDGHGWHYENILGAAGAAGVGYTGRPIGYGFTSQRTQHVNFPDESGNVQELWWDSASGWHLNNLTTAAGAPRTGANPTGYVFNAQGTQHVNYVGQDQHVYELWWNPAGWRFNDLTAATGAPLAEVNRNAPGYVFAAQGTQHVDYAGTDTHIHELWWDSNGWHHNDLCNATGAPGTNDEPAGYMFSGTQHVVYRGLDNHIHELWSDSNGWHDHDLTIATGAPATSYGRPTGYAFEAYGSQHVIYQDDSNHVMELYWKP
jgi:hypothetical protein